MATWDGSEWQFIPIMRFITIRAAGSFDPDGGGPEQAQLVLESEAGSLAIHDGVQWRVTGYLLSPPYGFAMEEIQSRDGSSFELAIGGAYSAQGIPLFYLARFDGTSIHPWGPRIDPALLASTTWDPDGDGPHRTELIMAGYSQISPGSPIHPVVRSDATSWSPLGDRLDGTVRALTTWDPDGSGPLPAQPVAGGEFIRAGSRFVNRVARWDGKAWQPVGSGISIDSVFATWTVYSFATRSRTAGAPDDLFAAAGNRVYQWDASVWRAISPELGTAVYALEIWDPDNSGPLPESLIAGGNFTTIDSFNHVARWYGVGWHPLGSGINAAVRTIESWDPDGTGPEPSLLCIGGAFTRAGDRVVNRVAGWNGASVASH